MCHDGKCEHGKCTTRRIAKWLLIIGGLNWGLIGIGIFLGGDWNILDRLLGAWPLVLGIVYLLVGISAVYKIFRCHCHTCKGDMDHNPGMGGMKGENKM